MSGVPSNSNDLTLGGGPPVDMTAIPSDAPEWLRQILDNINAALIGMGWPSAKQETGQTKYQAMYGTESGGVWTLWAGKPTDPLNPDEITSLSGASNAFGTIAVAGQSDVVADQANDTVTFIAGSGMTITTNAAGDEVTFAASGGGGASDSFVTIAVSGQNNIVADSPTDTLTIVAGSGITLTTDDTTDTLTIANSGALLAFKTISVSGQSDVVADSATDQLTLIAGAGIVITTNAGADEITFTSTATGTVTEAFKTIAVSGQSDIVADSATDTLTIASANSFLVITTNAGTDTLTLTVVVTAGDGITISGTTLNASGEIAIVTTEIDARTDATGPDYTMGSGQVTLLVRDSPGVYTTTGGSTGVTVYNSTQMAVPVDRIVQCKWIKGDLFVDVDDCDP
jgi:hypothetical protein